MKPEKLSGENCKAVTINLVLIKERLSYILLGAVTGGYAGRYGNVFASGGYVFPCSTK